jgi:excisionase family DNA binding protein
MLALQEPTMIDVKQVIERLGVSDSTVRRLVRDGKLRAYRVGRQLKFKLEDVERFLDQNAIEGRKDADEGSEESHA